MGILKRDDVVAAFADDIAIVVDNFWTTSPAMHVIFSEFEEISALALNIEKIVMIPVWPYSSVKSVRKLIRELCPGRRNLEIARKGKYLGFVLSPNATHEGWTKPRANFERQVNLRAGMRLGTAMNIIVFNMYIVPLLEYVGQLLPSDERVQDGMMMAMRRLASGPGNWVELRDLENFTVYGLPADLRTIDATAQAAKLRIAFTVASDAQKKCQELELVQSEFLNRPFAKLHQKSFYKVLNDNRIELQGLGLRPEQLRNTVNDSKDRRRKWDSLQKLARSQSIATTLPYNEEFRVQSKMQRWKFDGPDAILAARILRNFRTIGKNAGHAWLQPFSGPSGMDGQRRGACAQLLMQPRFSHAYSVAAKARSIR